MCFIFLKKSFFFVSVAVFMMHTLSTTLYIFFHTCAVHPAIIKDLLLPTDAQENCF